MVPFMVYGLTRMKDKNITLLYLVPSFSKYEYTGLTN